MGTRSTVLEHVVNPRRGDLSEEVAQFILSLDFPPADHARYAELSAKAQEGNLSEEDQAALDDFLNVNDFLTIIQAKARTTTPPPGPEQPRG